MAVMNSTGHDQLNVSFFYPAATSNLLQLTQNTQSLIFLPAVSKGFLAFMFYQKLKYVLKNDLKLVYFFCSGHITTLTSSAAYWKDAIPTHDEQ